MKTNLILIALSFVMFSACKKDDNEPSNNTPNEEELITTVKLRFENVSNFNDTVVAIFKDTDGDGGNAPSQFDTINLTNGTSYLLSLSLLDESDSNDIEDITEEVSSEGDEHQFFFGGTALSMGHISVEYGDLDNNNYPIGLVDTVTTNSTATNMTFRVTLRHEPNKSALNVSNGDITNAGGDTDIELDYIINVEN